MYSDNGSSFAGAEREIRQAIENWKQYQIRYELLQRECQWVFQPPKASHASGLWERLICSTRTALKAMLKESLMGEDVRVTVLAEVKATLNSRPLCAVSDDPNDLQPLTPNHLLLQRTVSALPPGTFVKEDMLFRQTSTKSASWRPITCSGSRPSQRKWHLGRIVMVIHGKDGLVRRVEVKTGSSSLLLRPIKKLCLLEESENLYRD